MIMQALVMAMNASSENKLCLGIAKQCVEYSRRWLYENKGVTYQDVRVAADIWSHVNYYTRVFDYKKIPVTNEANGSTNKPQPGDLLVYSEDYLVTGHVSVIVNIDINTQIIHLREQNYNNQYSAPYQKRTISYIKHQGGYWLLDKYLLGWKSLQVCT